MLILIECKVWFNIVFLYPLILSMVALGTLYPIMRPRDIVAAWELGNRMKTIGEIAMFVQAAVFFLTCLIFTTGLVHIEGFRTGLGSEALVHQICANR